MNNILLVDDNKYLLEALALTLGVSAQDYNLLKARNGLEAAAILDRKKVALVLTDLEMPFMNGYQLIEHKNRLYPSVPLIAMTSCASPAVVAKLRLLGITHCIEKPFDYEVMTRLIMENLSPLPFLMPGREIPTRYAAM
jgi:DNA-binding NtrC family response regulator